MTPTRRRINIELLLGISAIFLSLAALVVSIFQTKIAREQQQASVWPSLMIGSSHNKDYFSFVMINNGVGPAVIRKFEIIYAGKAYTRPIEILYDYTKDVNKIGAVTYSAVVPNLVLKAGEEKFMIESKGDLLTAGQLAELFDSGKCKLNVVYSDVYGNCWQSDGLNNEPLSDCPPSEKVKF